MLLNECIIVQENVNVMIIMWQILSFLLILIQIVWYADAVGVNASDESIDCMRVIL